MKILFYSLLVFFVACTSEKEVAPASAVASFESPKVVNVNDVVTLKNTSTNAVRYEWNFGDGNTSTIATPSPVYNSPGNYNITLTGYNDANEPNTKSQGITVGRRYIKTVKVNNIRFTDPNNQPWSADGVNLYVTLRNTTVSTQNVSSLKSTATLVKPETLPLVFDLSSRVGDPQSRTNISGSKSVDFEFYHIGSKAQYMGYLMVDTSKPSSNQDTDGNGSYITSARGFELEITYVTK